MKKHLISSVFLFSLVFLFLLQSVFAFTDVKGHKYEDAINYLYSQKIIDGYPNGTFKPDSSINRAEFSKIILNTFIAKNELQKSSETECFEDVKREWFAPYVCIAKNKKIITGYANRTFRPAQTINYVEALKIIYATVNDKGKVSANTDNTQWFNQYYQDAVDNGIALSDIGTNYQKQLTRGEMAELMKRFIEKKKIQLPNAIISTKEQEIPVTTTIKPTENINQPVVTNIKASISSGASFSLALKNDGTVWAWGDNGYGQLGDGTTINKTTPIQISSLAGITTILAKNDSALALKNDGTVWAWGRNRYGLLGDGTITDKHTPIQIPSLTGITAIYKTYNYSAFALKNDGTVWAWGYNGHGQLGDGTTTDRYAPVQISSLTGISTISATNVSGHNVSFALKNDGTVWAWGANGYGQLGDGTTTDRHTPVQVSSLTGIIAIFAKDYSALAIKDDGTVWMWGTYCENSTKTPIKVPSLTEITDISIGTNYFLALKKDGTVWAWGGNSQGQLGNGTTVESCYFGNYKDPSQVSSLTDITTITASILGSAPFSLAVKNDGTVWAWGNNSYHGKLGDGTTINKTTPVQVSSLTGITTVVIGWEYSFAVKNDGTIWAWGNNSLGELGLGDTTDHLTPEMITNFNLLK